MFEPAPTFSLLSFLYINHLFYFLAYRTNQLIRFSYCPAGNPRCLRTLCFFGGPSGFNKQNNIHIRCKSLDTPKTLWLYHNASTGWKTTPRSRYWG